jgi:hypothetical protein
VDGCADGRGSRGAAQVNACDADGAGRYAAPELPDLFVWHLGQHWD